MKIVVTGALGHIGSFLIRDLALEFPNSEIVMIDNLLTQRFSSLFNLPSVGYYQFIEADVTQIELEPILKGADVLIHLAAITDAAGSFDKAEILEFNNYQSTLKVAEACLKSGVRMITLSSTSVYGTQDSLVAEDCSPNELKPQSPYAATKLKEEQLVSKLYLEKGLKVVSLRFGTIFGASPGMRFHTAVNKFCWQAVMGEPITVWSTAYDQTRPYLDLNDAAKALAFIGRKDLFNGSTYNVLTHNVTVRNVVDTIRQFVPALEVSFVDSKIMNQLSYEVSCEKFKAEGFSFSGSLQRGIGDTINLLRNANK
jgi:nucleoside-diphosphate-sugar epimerase